MAKVGIIGAMELEVETLKSKMDLTSVDTRAGMLFYCGILNGTEVVVVRSGVGKVNAALCVQVLADLYYVTHVINTGVAGSLDAALDIGDLAISTDLMYHDVDAGAFGYTRGQVPGMDVHAFPTDPKLTARAEAICKARGYRCKLGRIVSGDQFVSRAAQKKDIIAHCGGICTEMEGAAIAHAAYRNGLPVLILRAISDKADDSAETDYPAFERQAAQRCAGLVEELIAGMEA